MSLIKKELIIIATIIVIFALLGIAAWFYLDYTAKTKIEKNNQANQQLDQCGGLVSENGSESQIAPFAPTLRAKISGSYDKTKSICEWSINNVQIPNTYPIRGECVFGGRSLASAGEYKITYNVTGLSGCPKTLTIVVK